ncbi:MAG: hypothetical protein HOO96_39550 [Polyangiaceae bacterium]|nr:hypothetical protein [Polyangiaceae bacterium]
MHHRSALHVALVSMLVAVACGGRVDDEAPSVDAGAGASSSGSSGASSSSGGSSSGSSGTSSGGSSSGSSGTGPSACVPTCALDAECQSSCPAIPSAVYCCDLTNVCYRTGGAKCPARPDPDAGIGGSMY